MINLLPTDIKQNRRYGRRNRQLLTYSILILLIGLASAAVLFINGQLISADERSLRKEITETKEKSSTLEKEQKNLSGLAADLNTIDKLYAGEVIFSQLLPQIGGLLPSGTVLNGLTLSGGAEDPLNLEIDMERQDLAAVFQQNLVNSDLFVAADIASINSKSADGGSEYPFSASISAKFSGSKKPTTGNVQSRVIQNGAAQ